MNEQLTVKNFGPIKDATVDFKRVTVFIGPTGGGKSTLAKLAAVFRDSSFFFEATAQERAEKIEYDLSLYGIQNFSQVNTDVVWHSHWNNSRILGSKRKVNFSTDVRKTFENNALPKLLSLATQYDVEVDNDMLLTPRFALRLANRNPEANTAYWNLVGSYFPTPKYIPADRVLAAFVTGNTFRLQSQRVGVASVLVDFLGDFENARDFFLKEDGLDIPFLDTHYRYQDNQHLVQIQKDSSKSFIPLVESASGVQSAVPLTLVTAYESRRHGATGFIIEEPELNLYPTAQQGLLNWLVEKCTKGENDLTITTHSPYILSHLNLLLYAYQVAEQHPDRREAVAAIVPEASWINPQEFACYQVENGGVQSLVDTDLGLIDNNKLDGLSGDAADAFDNLIRLSKGFAIK